MTTDHDPIPTPEATPFDSKAMLAAFRICADAIEPLGVVERERLWNGLRLLYAIEVVE